MNVYLQVFFYNYKRFLTYPLEIVSEIAKIILQVIFMSILWNLVLTDSHVGLSSREILAYFILVGSLSDLIMAERINFGKYLRDVIKDGSISSFLLRPLHLIRYLLFDALGQEGPKLIIAFIGIGIALIVNPPQNGFGLLFFFIFICMAIAISLSINMLIGIISFHITETVFLIFSTQQLVRIFSGAFLPLYFFPDRIREILDLSFLPFLVFRPIDSLNYTSLTNEHVTFIMIGIAWAVAMNMIVFLFWTRAIRKYEAIGL